MGFWLECTRGNGCPWSGWEGSGSGGNFWAVFLALHSALCWLFYAGLYIRALQSKPLNIPLLFRTLRQWAMCFFDDHMKIQSIFRAILLPGIISRTSDLNGELCVRVNAWNGYLKRLFPDLMFYRLTPLMLLPKKSYFIFHLFWIFDWCHWGLPGQHHFGFKAPSRSKSVPLTDEQWGDEETTPSEFCTTSFQLQCKYFYFMFSVLCNVSQCLDLCNSQWFLFQGLRSALIFLPSCNKHEPHIQPILTPVNPI